ncbi:Zinc finger SWIM domain-containing protein 7 [Oopsacas minuta]|uniref:Zinc finger SWIM domain-containing protein 7 n=1 Tax=Oopsacas minuta TaxID=111878 RepID=A0AAV7JIW0_9METZ|nr:Zinc finger SWIM domain-containing protein 7 [Oopsacas minuta]
MVYVYTIKSISPYSSSSNLSESVYDMAKVGNTNRRVSLREIAIHLFQEVKEQWTTDGEISDGLMRDLLTVFPNSLFPALDLVDHKAVTRLKSTSGRCVYEVASVSEQSYSCLLEANFCPCSSFHYSVLSKDEAIMCKHLLAIHISVALDIVSHIGVTNRSLTESLDNM